MASAIAASASAAASNPFELPSGTHLMQHQVAGHICQQGKDTIGILKDQLQPGTVLKAANKPVCGQREIQFYRRVYGDVTTPTTDPPYANAAELRALTPHFYGTVTLPVAGRRVDFLRLQDATHDMLEPCVMDVKIGARTWDPLATRAKIEAERDKYSACKSTLGFCVPGFQVYRTDGPPGIVRRHGKEFGKNLDRHNLRSVLQTFLNADASGAVNGQLLREMLDGLAAIRRWACTQNALRLFSSSILLAYDASALRSRGDDGGGHDERRLLRTQVKMIDFAHAFETELCAESRTDTGDRNYADGVDNLCALFEGLLPAAVDGCKEWGVQMMEVVSNGTAAVHGSKDQ